MKHLKNKAESFKNLQEAIFVNHPISEIALLAEKILRAKKYEGAIVQSDLMNSIESALAKTETFTTLLTLVNLDQKYANDEDMHHDMKDLSFNAHVAIAMNICDMYGCGASRFFGVGELFYEDVFGHLNREQFRFLSKGIIALAASAASGYLTHGIREVYINKNLAMLKNRGISTSDMVDELLALQIPYNPTLTYDDCKEHVFGVLAKQQVYHIIKLAYKIDVAVETGECDEDFCAIVGNDEGLYGIDETLAMGISKLYGMISITNFGLLDKIKPGKIKELDCDHRGGRCNTFMDDILCAIIAAACGRLAHNNENTQSKPADHQMII